MRLALIAPRSGLDHDLVDVLTELAVAHVLEPFVCVEAEGQGRWIDEQGAHESGAISELLARRGQLDLVRIVGVSLDDSSVEPSWTSGLTSLRDSLSAAGIPVTLGVVASCTVGNQIPSEVFGTFWNYNIVLVPQESLGERGTFPVLIDDPRREMMMAVPAVALAGGLWRFVDGSPADNFTAFGEGNVQRVRLGRVVTRVVDAGDLTARAVDRALGAGAQLPAPPGCVQHAAPKQAVDNLVNTLAPRSGPSPIGFSFNKKLSPPRPSTTRMTIWAAIKYFFKELFSELKPMARAAVMAKIESVRQGVEAVVQAMTFGADSDVVVRLKRPHDALFLLNQDERRRAIDDLPNMKSSPLVQSPATWHQLVCVLLGAVDGGDMPKGLEAAQPQWSGERAVIGSVDHVATLPDALSEVGLALSQSDLEMLGFTDSSDLVVSSYDVVALDALRLGVIPTQSPGSEATTGADASAVGVELPGAETPTPDAEADTDDAFAQSSEVSPPAEAARKKVSSWIDARKGTVLWGLGERLAASQAAALSEFETTQAQFGQIFAEIEEATKAAAKNRKRFVVTSLLILLVVFVLAALTVVGLFIFSTLAVAILAGAFLLSLVGGIFKVLRLAAARVRWRHRLEELGNAPAQLFARRQHAGDEFRRLSVLYQQYLDWALIITAAVHRPWGEIENVRPTPWTTQTGILSFSVGEPVVSQAELAAAALGVTQRVAVQGWLSRAYNERQKLWLDWYGSLTDGLAGLAHTPEEDATSAEGFAVSIPASSGMDAIEVKRPRQQFCDSVLRGDFADAYRIRQVDSLRDEVSRRDPARLIERVDSDVSGLHGRTAYEFLRPPVENPAIPKFDFAGFVAERYLAQGNLSVESWVGCSPSIEASVPEGRHSHPLIELKDRFLLASFRLDLSDPIPSVDCPLIKLADADGDEPRPLKAVDPGGSGLRG